ncbi:hypothetical protein DL764_010148 [Monosporascus ibericus]|uniref:Uncharacterized protein n=1 Tax=Monosporascus ibericus TaxID=155417 RepID=A0A4V1X8S3_9PEZI|nr:hypothetical protein DL764_010148 [Monosporascus ibericus]
MPFVHRLEESWGQDKEACEELMQSRVQDCVLEGVSEHNADRFSELCRVQDIFIRDLEQRERNAEIATRESTERLRCSEAARGHLRVLVTRIGRPAGCERPQGQIDRLTLEASSRPESPSLEERGSFHRREIIVVKQRLRWASPALGKAEERE